MRILSFGGGTQTSALAVMLARGELGTVDHVVFADTAGETPATYRHVAVVAEYLARYGHELEVVRFNGPTLEEYTLTRSTPIPIRTATNFGRRQCTNKWKIEPVKRFARARGAEHLNLILGFSYDELYRMKPDRARWITREFPLVERRLTKEDCRRIAASAGLPPAPKSACFYCPLQGLHRWRWLAAEEPELFARAVAMERAINDRRDDGDPAYLSSAGVPLTEIVTAGAMLPGFGDAFEEECEGVCAV